MVASILNFETDFDGANIIRLEQNYRSTGNILQAASSLISENKERIGKKLWTSDPTGDLVDIVNVERIVKTATTAASSIRVKPSLAFSILPWAKT